MCQIGEEATRVAQRAAVAAGAQDSQANKDNVLTAATIVIFGQRRFLSAAIVQSPPRQPPGGVPSGAQRAILSNIE
jgi:hypothetical protein